MTRGPIPKRTDKRRHRIKPAVPVDKIEVQGEVHVPPPMENWHPIALNYYLSLAESAQSRYYEPSDWAHAIFIVDVMSKVCINPRVSGANVTAVLQGLQGLMATEGDRRRLHLEITRETQKAESEDDENVVDFRAFASGG